MLRGHERKQGCQNRRGIASKNLLCILDHYHPHQDHSFPPTRNSLPIATPDAAEITTDPLARIVARATSCLTGASTELVSLPPLAVKVTTVPSGTGFPEQSRTGSV